MAVLRGPQVTAGRNGRFNGCFVECNLGGIKLFDMKACLMSVGGYWQSVSQSVGRSITASFCQSDHDGTVSF